VARRKFPSDHRPWFRVLTDVLDDPKLNSLEQKDQIVFIRLLATLQRMGSRDGIIVASDRVLKSIADRDGARAALASLRRQAEAGLASVSHQPGATLITVHKWAKLQGFAPTPVVPRVEKSREEESTTPTPSPATPETPSKPKAPKRKRIPATPWPAEGLTLDQKRELAASPSLKDLTPSQLRHACDAVRSWAEGGGHERVDWVAVIRGGIGRGWALEGYTGGDRSPGKRPTGRGSTDYAAAPVSSNWDALMNAKAEETH
jgi:hypothetical protein